MKNLLTILLLTCFLFLFGCLRGETKSLSQVFEIARSNFLEETKKNASNHPDIDKKVSQLALELEKLIHDQNNLNQIEQTLTELLPHATYTVRPALTEVRNQFLQAVENNSVSPIQTKMLATKVYNVLTEELRQGKFSN